MLDELYGAIFSTLFCCEAPELKGERIIFMNFHFKRYTPFKNLFHYMKMSHSSKTRVFFCQADMTESKKYS